MLGPTHRSWTFASECMALPWMTVKVLRLHPGPGHTRDAPRLIHLAHGVLRQGVTVLLSLGLNLGPSCVLYAWIADIYPATSICLLSMSLRLVLY